jgi:hypothetical protein
LSEGKVQLEELTIMVIFLGGLPKEYVVWVNGIELTGKENQNVILLRL